MNDGIYTDMTREQYDALTERENWSRLKVLGRSPAHYRHALLEPRKDTDALKNGRANHIAVFEPEKFASSIAIWDGGDRRGKAWTAFREENAGKDILRQDEYALLIGMQRAIQQHPDAGKYLRGGKPEASVLWTYKPDPMLEVPPVPCKSRLDYLSRDWIVDLKTCRDASPGAFGRAAFNFEYHAQAAFYVDAVAAVTGKRLPYIVVAAELTPPCVVQVYVLPEHVLAAGRDRYRSLMFRLAECRRTDSWGGYADEEMELELPRWSGIETPEPEGESPDELGLSIGE